VRRVPRPTDDAEAVFRTCASKVRGKASRSRIEGVAAAVGTAARDYAQAGEAGNLRQLQPHSGVAGIVTTEEMVALYESHFASSRGVARSTYDRIMVLPKNGTCPHCSVRTVSTLDHHLPKSGFPSYAVTPLNLVSCCRDCNWLKGEHAPAGHGQEFMHPYFDDIEADVWLHAMVVASAPPAVLFAIQGPASSTSAIADKLRFHFSTLKLDALYRAYAAEEMSSIMHTLRRLHASQGTGGVRAEMQERHASCLEAARNAWNTALYKALSESDWYCDGGFAF
jgi:hypothetical protein